MILEQTIDLAGKIRILWQQPSGTIYSFKFQQLPTQEAIQALADAKEANEIYFNEQLITNLGTTEVVRELVEIIKARPNITPSQFATYLSTRPWYIEAEIRTIIFRIGTALANRKELTLTDLTEAQFFTKVRDFLASTPTRRLAKLLLNLDNY